MNSKNKSNRPPETNTASTLTRRIRHALVALLALTALPRAGAADGQTLLLTRPLALKWSFPSDSLSGVAPAYEGGAVYLALAGGEIVSLRIGDGLLAWKTKVGGDVSATPTADRENLYIANEVSEAGGAAAKAPAVFLRSLSRSSGVILWFRALPRAVGHAADQQPSPLLVLTLDNIVIGIDKETGAVRWSSQLAGRIMTAPILYRDLAYLALDSGDLLTVRLQDGAPLSRYRTRERVSALSAGADGTIYWGSAEGHVGALTEVGGAWVLSWRRRLGAEVQSLDQTADGLLAVSRDNAVTFLKRLNGKRVWKRRLSNRIAAQPLLRDDAGLFAPLGEDSCIVLSLRDGKQVNTIYLGENNSVVAPPVMADNYLLIPTRLGLLAFTQSGQSRDATRQVWRAASSADGL